MNFSEALQRAKDEYRIARKGWNGKSMWVSVQYPLKRGNMSLPYLFLKTVDDHLVPWLPSQTDILSDDWSVVKGMGIDK